MDNYNKVDVNNYVKEGLKNGTLIPKKAVKFARIIAKRGSLGEEVISWSINEYGEPIKEKVACIAMDKETNNLDWIATKTDENGNKLIDQNGHLNQWIINDSTFIKKYELDPNNNELYRPKGGIQIFVQINDNIILNQWGSDMMIAKGGYINITNVSDMYGISERDFLDTYSYVNKKDRNQKKNI